MRDYPEDYPVEKHICSFEWDGTRQERVPYDVRYSCYRPAGHAGVHRDYRWDETFAVPEDEPTRPTETPGAWLESLTGAERKEVAVARGLFGYFPDALALIARHSVRSNEKHNPGQPVHWARSKSTDQEDCIGRHSLAVAIDPDSLDDGQPHIICRAWRALAALQLWAEAKHAKGEKL